MDFGVNTWVWISPTTAEKLRQLAPKVKTMGFDLIEFGIESITDLDYKEAALILEDHELGVSVAAAMGPDRDLVHDDPTIQRNGVKYLQHCVMAASSVGATNLVGPMYAAVGRTWEQTPDQRAHDVDVLVGHLQQLAIFAHEHDVVLGIEPLNRFETSFINTAQQAMDVVNRVDHSACNIMLDTFHMNIEEKSLGQAIRLTGDRLVHVHACENDRGAPGSGHVSWIEVAQALQDIGYDGPVVIESFTNQVKTIARAAAIWRSFEPSQDDLAETGLNFLHHLLDPVRATAGQHGYAGREVGHASWAE